MAEIGLRTKMLVRDVMSSPVVTMDEDETSNKAATNMDMHDLGAVIVTNKAGKSVGIITERDLVIRVIAKNLKPDTVKAKEIMTTPLVTVEPEATISDAARRMTRLDIREIILEITKNYDFPIIANADFGHDITSMPMPEGILARMNAEELSFELIEPVVN